MTTTDHDGAIAFRAGFFEAVACAIAAAHEFGLVPYDPDADFHPEFHAGYVRGAEEVALHLGDLDAYVEPDDDLEDDGDGWDDPFDDDLDDDDLDDSEQRGYNGWTIDEALEALGARPLSVDAALAELDDEAAYQ